MRRLTICFVDFQKAFDSVNREAMFTISPLYGIPQTIVEAIKALYTNTKATVITTDGETPFFDIKAGVLQGDTIAPFLFIIVLDFVLRLSLDSINDKGMQIQPRRSQRHPARFLTDLDSCIRTSQECWITFTVARKSSKTSGATPQWK